MKNSYSLKPISFIFGDWMFMINSENMFTLDEAEGDYEFRLIAYDDKNEFIFLDKYPVGVYLLDTPAGYTAPFRRSQDYYERK